MTLGEHVFLYCERGTSVALWAEPINAISNAGFLLAALIFWQLLLWRPPEARSADHYLLMALVFLIGLGSLAFHLFATRGTELADVIPISLFMLIYLGFALNRFLEVPPGWTVLLVIVFAGLIGVTTQINCGDGVIGLAGGSVDAKPCLNGSVGYLPALGALIVVGMLLAERGHRAAPYVLAAAVIFIGSIILRSADLSLCDRVAVEGRDVGTHFIWHLLNALVLFLLLRASLETGTKQAAANDAAPVPVPVETEQAASEPVEGTGAAQEDEVAQSKETEPEPVAEADDAEPLGKDEPKESDASEKTGPEAGDDSAIAESDAKDEPEQKGEPEGEAVTGSQTDETDGDALKKITAPSDPEASAETPPPDEDSPPDETEPDEAPTPEDVFKAVKALSTEDSSEQPPRKRGSRRRKPPLSD